MYNISSILSQERIDNALFQEMEQRQGFALKDITHKLIMNDYLGWRDELSETAIYWEYRKTMVSGPGSLLKPKK